MELIYGISNELSIKRRIDKKFVLNGSGMRNFVLNSTESEVVCKFNGGVEIDKLLKKIHSDSERERIKTVINGLIDRNILVSHSNRMVDIDYDWTLDEVFLELTKQCNLKCHHCYIPKDIHLDELKKSDWNKVIKECAELGVGLVKVTGGEPMLHPDFYQIVKEIMDNNMEVRLYTNGSNLNEETINKLKRLSVNELQISVDGASKETHDSFRRTNGNFNTIMKALPLLEKYKFNIILSFTVTDYNVNEMELFCSLASQFSNVKIVISPYINYHQTYKIDNLVNVNGDIIERLNYCFENNKHIWSDKIRYSLTFSNKYIGYCGFGIYSLYIDSTGKILMCPLVSDIVVGNVSDGIPYIWGNSEILNQYRAHTLADVEQCNLCKNINICKGGCRARAYIANGSFFTNDPISCQMY